jgi:hypothetical protein
VIVLGGYLGVATESPRAIGRRWLAGQLRERGIVPPLADTCLPVARPSLYARLFTHEGRGYALLANLSGRALVFILGVREGVTLCEKPYDLLTGRACPRAGERGVSVVLPKDEVMWLCL